MSQYSLDSLDSDKSFDNKFSTSLTKGSSVPSIYVNLKESREHREASDTLFLHRTVEDVGFNEREEAGVAIRREDPEKSCGNALIASTVDAIGKCRLTEEKLVVALGATLDFRIERPAAKKLDEAGRSSSSSSSLPEFRLRASPPACGKKPDGIEGFMKASKKLGKARRTIVDRGKKKRVSYLELYRRKFGVESRRCILTPEGSTPSICGDRTDERLVYVDERASAAVSGDDESEVGFYRRVMELGSREPRETRSCEALDRSGADQGVSKSSCDVSECFSDVVQPVDRTRRVVYKPYSVEDYERLSVPQLDRSLGPDRIEMETKGEWLMRRRSYGDSVSGRNRQRILRRAQKLKELSRVDVQKLRLPSLTDVENPDPASKLDGKQEGIGIIGVVKSPKGINGAQKKQSDTRVSRVGKFPSLVPREKAALSKSKPGSKVRSSLSESVYETGDDTVEDSTLKHLRLRHLEEKKRIDQLLKRGLYA